MRKTNIKRFAGIAFASTIGTIIGTFIAKAIEERLDGPSSYGEAEDAYNELDELSNVSETPEEPGNDKTTAETAPDSESAFDPNAEDSTDSETNTNEEGD